METEKIGEVMDKIVGKWAPKLSQQFLALAWYLGQQYEILHKVK